MILCQLENENKVLIEKFEKLSKDLANFVDGTKNLDKLIRVQKSFYDRTSLGLYKNPKKVFQKPKKNTKAKRKCSNYRYLRSYYFRKRKVLFRKVTNTQGPNKLWVSKILLLSNARMSAPKQ